MVCVLGADSSAGAPLCMLLQRSGVVDDLSLYGRQRPERLAAELACLPERPVVEAYGSEDGGLQCALKGSQLVLLAEGGFRSDGTSRDHHFNTFVGMACKYGHAIGAHAPLALVGVLTAPISAVVPVVWECVRRAGGRQPERRVMGIATLQEARAVAEAARVLKMDPAYLKITVSGGTGGITVVPILSALDGTDYCLTQLETSAVMSSVATAGHRIRRAYGTHGCATPCKDEPGDVENCSFCGAGGNTAAGMPYPAFSVAYAAVKFVDAVIRALSGYRHVSTNAFVLTRTTERGMQFETVPVSLGRNGILGVLPVPCPTEAEARLLRQAHSSLVGDVNMAKTFLTSVYGPSEVPSPISDDCYDFKQKIINPVTRRKDYETISEGVSCFETREGAHPCGPQHKHQTKYHIKN